MLPPEIQRIVLLIGLAATGYLMILAWNDDMQEAKQPVQYDDAPLLEGQLPLSDTPAVADRPGATASSDNDSDVPSAALAWILPAVPAAVALTVAISFVAASFPLRLFVVLVAAVVSSPLPSIDSGCCACVRRRLCRPHRVRWPQWPQTYTTEWWAVPSLTPPLPAP